jgi:hypothetical protein
MGFRVVFGVCQTFVKRTGADGAGRPRLGRRRRGISLSLLAEVEARLRAEAVKRDLSPEELATRAIKEHIPEGRHGLRSIA